MILSPILKKFNSMLFKKSTIKHKHNTLSLNNDILNLNVINHTIKEFVEISCNNVKNGLKIEIDNIKKTLDMMFIIGSGCVGGLIFIITNNYKINYDKNIMLNKDIDKLDNKIDNLEKKINIRFNKLDNKIDNLENKLNVKIDNINNKIEELKNIIEKQDNKRWFW